MGLDVTEEEILAVMNFLPEREIYKVLNIESFVTRAAIHGSYTLGSENLSTCNRIYIFLQFHEQVFLIPYFPCLHFEIIYLSNWHFFEHLIISEVKSVNNLPTSCNVQKVNKKIRGLELPVLMRCLSWKFDFKKHLVKAQISQWSLSVLSNPQKYQCDSMGLHEFFYHSAVVSCITFHVWKSVDCYFSNKVYRDILRFL